MAHPRLAPHQLNEKGKAQSAIGMHGRSGRRITLSQSAVSLLRRQAKGLRNDAGGLHLHEGYIRPRDTTRLFLSLPWRGVRPLTARSLRGRQPRPPDGPSSPVRLRCVASQASPPAPRWRRRASYGSDNSCMLTACDRRSSRVGFRHRCCWQQPRRGLPSLNKRGWKAKSDPQVERGNPHLTAPVVKGLASSGRHPDAHPRRIAEHGSLRVRENFVPSAT
jgi:hypothetical protein